MAVNPDGSKVYVAGFGSVWVIDTAVSVTIPIAASAFGLAVVVR